MTQFRKKPLLVDAVPVDDFLEGNPLPEWVAQAMKVEPGAHEARVTRIPNGIDIVTKQGQVVGAGSGEWLLCAAPDDLWPVDGDVFEATYEPPSASPGGPPEAWQGEPPAEGTRRWQILEALKGWILANPGKPVTSEEEAIEFADSIEIALQSAAEQPSLAERLGDSPAQRAMDAD